jgi:hypothetical protein
VLWSPNGRPAATERTNGAANVEFRDGRYRQRSGFVLAGGRRGLLGREGDFLWLDGLENGSPLPERMDT